MTTHEHEHDEDDDRTDLQRLSDARRTLRGALLDRVLAEADRDPAPDANDD